MPPKDTFNPQGESFSQVYNWPIDPATGEPATTTPGGDATAANQTALLTRIGEVQASPTANTLLDRLKTLAGYTDGIEAGIALLATEATLGGMASTQTAMSAKLPASLGIKTAAASFSIAPASDANFIAVGNVAAAATDSGSPVKAGGVYNSTLPTYTTGQRGDVQLGSRGSLNVQLVGADTTTKVTAVAPADGAANSGNGILAAARVQHFNGTTWDMFRGDTLGTWMQGPTAHDAAITGNPLRIGARARDTNMTAVAANDATDLVASLDGVLIMRQHAIGQETWQDPVSGDGGITTATETTIKSAAGAGIRRICTGLQLTNLAATATLVRVRDGSAGTILWKTKLPASMTTVLNFAFSPGLRGSAATALVFETVTASAEVHVSAQGYNSAG